ncbi:MAG: SGNH/GDSL hydrolase family protein [Clostridia bacterium]|nr:SGNH/GDSL hydrolase family protein [Clostridia bacterium]
MKILFVGNSYTYFNDMPAKLLALCNENGIEAEIRSVTRGGYSFAHYLSEENEKGIEFRAALADCKYDYIVLQDQSVRPAEHTEAFLESARRLCDMVRKNGAVPVFYQTWGRREGSEVLEKHGWTHAEMHALLRNAYVRAAEENGARTVFAGDAFRAAYAEGVDVYHPDGSHPSDAGSAVIAKAFFDAVCAPKK